MLISLISLGSLWKVSHIFTSLINSKILGFILASFKILEIVPLSNFSCCNASKVFETSLTSKKKGLGRPFRVEKLLF